MGELIDFYIQMLQKKQESVNLTVERLEKGLTIMEQVQAKVDGLKEDLNVTMIQVEEKKKATGILIEQVTVESEKATALAADAAAIKAEADGELSEAMPAMEAAKDAVNCLSKSAIQELKALGRPPPECVEVC